MLKNVSSGGPQPPLSWWAGGGQGGLSKEWCGSLDAFTAHDGAVKASCEALQVLMIRGSRPPADRWYR